MTKTTKDILFIILFTLGTTLLLWLPFLLNLTSLWGIQIPEGGFEIIKRNYDGLNYVIIAKSFYFPNLIQQFPQSLPPAYFAAHFPGYPLAILLFAPLIGYLNSMLAVSVLATAICAIVFYFLLQEVGITQHRLWLTIVFLLLPARWVIVRSVGSPESLFFVFLFLSLLFFMRALKARPWNNFLLASIFGAGTVLTRSPGILLFIAYGTYLLFDGWHRSNKSLSSVIKTIRWQAVSIILIPLTLLGVFSWYATALGDFWAYFNSGDNIHLTFPPFQVFNTNQYWVGSMWLEDILFYFFIYLASTLVLFRRKLYPLAFFSAIYYIAIISVAHRDIARYSLPLAPLAIIAFSDILEQKVWRTVIIVLSIGIYLYALNFMVTNTFPVSTLAPYT